MNEWIRLPKVEGRYPETDQLVLLAVDYGGEPTYEIGSWNGKRWYVSRLGELALAHVVCWMPLPELPR